MMRIINRPNRHTITSGMGVAMAGVLLIFPTAAIPAQPTSPAQKAAPAAPVPTGVLNLQDSFANVAEAVKPAVVSVSTVHEEQAPMPEFFFGDPFEQFFEEFFPGQPHPATPRRGPRPRSAPRRFRAEGMGSGVLISADGLVLTNEHVVRDADEIKVMVYSSQSEKKEYKAEVVGKDPQTDLALIRIKAGKKLPFAVLGNSDSVRIGDWAIAVGSPFGLEQTVTAGIISADRQALAIEGRRYQGMIQTDAAINRGNSGGPLVNIRGEVIGINTAIYAPTGVFSGVGFAVPINQAKEILDELRIQGRVIRGWLGIELASEISPAMVKAFGLPGTEGALVNNVSPDSPAAKAGLQRGDVIVAFNGDAVQSADDLQKKVARANPKARVKLEVIRNRQRTKLQVTLGERPASADGVAKPAEPGRSNQPGEQVILGAQVSALTPELAAQFNQPPDTKGVIVVEITPGGTAEEIGLFPGDVIRHVNQKPTPDVASLQKELKSVKLEEGIVLDVLRQGRPLFLSYTKQS